MGRSAETKQGQHSRGHGCEMGDVFFLMRRVDAVSRLQPHAHDKKSRVCITNCGEVCTCTDAYMC